MAMEAPNPAAAANLGDAMQRGNLTAAKESRKRAELDAQLLANRIALLKQEQSKAQKRIDETKNRAGEIMALRVQNEKKVLAKEEYYRSKWESIRAMQAQNAYMRDKQKANKDAVKQALDTNKKALVQTLKASSQGHLLQKKQREADEKENNMARTALIKKQREEGVRRRALSQNSRLEQCRYDYEARMATEEMMRARTEALVAQMEKEEMELIGKLQLTQTQQRQAYEELEAALGATSQPPIAPNGK